MKEMNPFRAASVCVAIVVAVLAGSAGADQTVKHSGTIVSIAPDTRTFVLAEVGPWRTDKGATVVTYRTITLAPETQFAIVTRLPGAASGFAEDFVEIPVGPEDVLLNAYITIECRLEGQRLIAQKITVTETAE